MLIGNAKFKDKHFYTKLTVLYFIKIDVNKLSEILKDDRLMSPTGMRSMLELK